MEDWENRIFSIWIDPAKIPGHKPSEYDAIFEIWKTQEEIYQQFKSRFLAELQPILADYHKYSTQEPKK